MPEIQRMPEIEKKYRSGSEYFDTFIEAYQNAIRVSAINAISWEENRSDEEKEGDPDAHIFPTRRILWFKIQKPASDELSHQILSEKFEKYRTCNDPNQLFWLHGQPVSPNNDAIWEEYLAAIKDVPESDRATRQALALRRGRQLLADSYIELLTDAEFANRY